MNYSKTGLALTESFEGLRLTAYQDSVGRWTIGYGHTNGVQPGQTITLQQAEAFLVADVAWAVAFVNHVLTVLVSQGEFDALVDFVFNLGSGHWRTARCCNSSTRETLRRLRTSSQNLTMRVAWLSRDCYVVDWLRSRYLKPRNLAPLLGRF
jgi:GH24 family phage-related lysozyme (muramidase)